MRLQQHVLLRMQPWKQSAFCTGRQRYEIPRHAVGVTHSRSSGPGGQNVNKVNTKVTLRLAMSDAAIYLPDDVAAKLREQQKNRINKDDELLLQCDEERTQALNLKKAFVRLQSLVDQASIVYNEYISRHDTPPPPRVKERRLQQKKQHSAKKSSRSRRFED